MDIYDWVVVFGSMWLVAIIFLFLLFLRYKNRCPECHVFFGWLDFRGEKRILIKRAKHPPRHESKLFDHTVASYRNDGDPVTTTTYECYSCGHQFDKVKRYYNSNYYGE